MAVKKYKPTSAGRRPMATSSFEEITRASRRSRCSSRSRRRVAATTTVASRRATRAAGTSAATARSTSSASRTACRRRSRTIEYDPNRSARIALLHYADGAKAYILAPAGLEVGHVVQSGPGADIKPGNALPLGDIPTGTVVHAVELRPGQGAKMARSAGSGVQLVAKDAPYGVLRLPSGEMRRVLLTCRATVGQVGNSDHANESSGKAGRSRWLGQAAVRARHGHEPGRPPARRRRGQVQGPPPRDPVGRADAREAHPPQAQGVRQADRPRPSPRQGKALVHVEIVQEGAFRRGAAARPRRGHERRPVRSG